VLSSKSVTSIDTRTGARVGSFTQFEAPTQIIFRGNARGPSDVLRLARARQADFVGGGVSDDRAIASTGVVSPNADTGRWTVWHTHGSGAMCVGALYVQDGRIGFRSPEASHTWDVPLTAVDEIEPNRMFQGGGRNGSFHVKLRSGANYNFSSAEYPPDRLGPSLKAILARSRGAK
jgi:hypothetical protein